MDKQESVYELKAVAKSFSGPGGQVDILQGIDLNVSAGDSLAILGSSGSGKTTLLHLMGTLDTPSSGTIFFRGKDLVALSSKEQAEVRNISIGFVFQFHHLLPEFSTLENVAMPGLIKGMDKKKIFDIAFDSLEKVGLAERKDQYVNTLSGGERQRVAIARAIVLRPQVILADEPTGNLDENTGQDVGDLLARLNNDLQTTLVVVTHNQDLAKKMKKQFVLQGGELYARKEQ
jgi:lipoprotein-releasing system ATP-binding protein